MMSSSLAIAAVTATLRDRLQEGLDADVSGTTVTTRPLDIARSNVNGSQVNLFMYHTSVSGAWRNMDVPWKVKQGETGHPPLPLDLYYLITAYYGENEDEIDTTTDANRLLGSHRLLGRAMGLMHDQPLMDTASINAKLPPADRLEQPYDQVETVRITPQPISLDEMSKLWSGFQTQYRLSVAYQVSVVLVESTRRSKTPLPVLTRGPDDEGVSVQADVLPPFPTLQSAQTAGSQPSARLGEVLTLGGHHLDADSVEVLFDNPLLTDPVPTQILANTPTKIEVKLLDSDDDPNAPARWAAGIYSVSATVSQANKPQRTTNELPFALAPRIEAIAPNPAPRDANGDVTLTLTCTPQVRPEQRVALLLGDGEFPAQPRQNQTGTLLFEIENAPTGDHFIRLRVDGVDSLLIDRTVSPPVFIDTQKVSIL
jgi:hypothetical protein